MRRYIWLGDSKYGGSVYWDKKNEIIVRNEKSKSSAKNSQLNIVLFTVTFLILIILRYFSTFFETSKMNINYISIFLFTLFFTIITTFFIYYSIYGNSKNYIETTYEDAIYAIKSTGYLENPFIFMAVDNKLNCMVVVFIILSIFFGLSQIIPVLNFIQNIFRIPCMILFISIFVYMIYLVNFKKDNRLKL